MTMKKIFLAFLALCGQVVYAQNNKDLFHEDQNIRELLNLNLNYNTNTLPDSVALYSFYIKITPQKNRAKDIYVSSPMISKIFGNIDSLFKGTDFNKFLQGTKQKFVIIPIGILVEFHQKMNTNSKFKVLELTKGIPKLMAEEDRGRYKAVFLNPFFVIIDKKIYN